MLMASESDFFSPFVRAARWLSGRSSDLDSPIIDPPRAVPAAVNPLTPASPRYGYWHAEKFPGGMGPVNLLAFDYWTLRARSSEAFATNIYARGLIRRLVTNIINTGLQLESTPNELVLGMPEESLTGWSEVIESRFDIWESTPKLCDYRGQQTFGQLQAAAELAAFVSGDVLVVLHQDSGTKLPLIELVDGASVQTPMDRAFDTPGTNRVVEGVEIDADGRHVAYYIRQKDGVTAKRIPTFDNRGRPIAWLHYACDKRHNAVRGEPILSLVLQSLKEIDRYRDAVQRKALLNAFLAVYLKREQQTAATRPIAGAGITRGTGTALDSSTTERTFNTAEYIPGLVLDNLQPGEEPHGFQPNGTDEKFGDFEEAIIQAVAWANEIPPEILRLAFSHNYSASQAANNEFNLYLYRARHDVAISLCQPVYREWLLSEALTQRFDRSQEIIDAWANPSRYDIWGAWTDTDWSGQIKPAADILKVTNAHVTMCENGFELRSRAARELTGGKFRRFIRQAKRENELLAEALEPLEAVKAKPVSGAPSDASGAEDTDEQVQDLQESA